MNKNKNKIIIFALSLLCIKFSFASLDDGLLPQFLDSIPLTTNVLSKSMSNSIAKKTLNSIRHSYGIVNEILMSLGSASLKTKETINKILKEINYNKEIEIKRLHWIGRFFKGKNNILVSSAGNLIVSEDWFNNLTYEEQKFIVAQRIAQLENYHNVARFFIKFNLGAMRSIIRILSNEEGFNLGGPSRVAPFDPIMSLISLTWHITQLNIRRKLSSEADKSALKKIGHAKGADQFFQRRLNYEHDNSIVGSFQMFKERIRDIIGHTPLYYFSRANSLNENRIKDLAN